MAATATSIPVPKKVTKSVASALTGESRKSRADKQREELEEAAALQRFKDLMLKYAGKCSLDGCVD